MISNLLFILFSDMKSEGTMATWRRYTYTVNDTSFGVYKGAFEVIPLNHKLMERYRNLVSDRTKYAKEYGQPTDAFT